MRSQDFDKHIKNLLSDHKVSIEPSNWDSMEEMLDGAVDVSNAETAKFDEAIQGKLHSHKLEFNKAHWRLLRRKLDLQDQIRQKIYVLKSLEMAILALLVFSFFQIDSYKDIVPFKKKKAETNVIYADQSTPTTTAQPIAEAVQETSSTQYAIAETKEVTTPVMRKESSQSTLFSNQIAEQSFTEDLAVSSSSNESTAERTNTVYPITPDQRSPEVIAAVSGSDNETSKVNNAEFVNDKSVLSSNIIHDQLTTDYLNSSFEQNMLANTAQLDSKYLSTVAYDREDSEMSLALIEPKAKTEKWISGGMSTDLNIINTPFDVAFSTNPVQTGALGATAFAAFGLKNAGSEFEVGLAYGNKSYNPNITEEINEPGARYRNLNLNNISFKIIEVPIMYKRHLVEEKDWSFYSVTGISFNMVAYANYELLERTLKVRVRTEDITKASKFSKKDFDKGLFQGESVHKNSYLTSVVGFGFQRNLNKGLAVYMQPQYQFHFFDKALGPNEDKLDAFNVRLGVRKKI